VPLQAELSTQQAAELMGVSRPYFVKLLEQGRIPFRKVGEQRRVRYQDLLRYLEEYQREAAAAVSEMSAEAQRLGFYE
jgi:excisionase family DNA binding protein